jgi:hypothetical protein
MKYSFVFLLLSLLFIVSCGEEENVKKDSGEMETAGMGHKVTVQEVIQANRYTYLKVEENSSEYWIAISKKPVEEGETLYYMQGVEMKDFESEDLDRTFESVIFVDRITDKPMDQMMGAHSQGQMGQKPDIVREDISVESVEGGISIKELYADLNKFENKVVKVKGKVTVYNPEIMNRNWIHIQDGTGFEDNFDLTITSNDEVKVGDIVAFEGKIAVDKDFGFGYKYKVLLENASLVK